jgi:ArsR family transcriptional regulator
LSRFSTKSQPKISRHLAYLRNAGIVAARREGKWMHYSICAPADPSAASILTAVLACLAQRRADAAPISAKLDRACCAPQKRVVPERAPRPALIACLPESWIQTSARAV